MFGYYMELALRSLLRNKVLTALMVLAIGLGIGASMTMLTVLHVMTVDPAPERSHKLFHVQIDPWPLQNYHEGEEPAPSLSWVDAMNLLHAGRAVHQVAHIGGRTTIIPAGVWAHAFDARARYNTSAFFAMFGVPFISGHAWSASDDAKSARVVVITRALAEKLFGTTQAVGKIVRMSKYDFTVVGVVSDWNPLPHYFDLEVGSYSTPEDVFVPLRTALDLRLRLETGINCWGDFPQELSQLRQSECAWVKYWVELDTPAQVAAYRQYLVHYSRQQKRLGRFERPPNVRLRDAMQWLDFRHVVPGSVQLQTLLALGFLLVCLVNTVALLLVKFLRRGGDLSVRRAMGASRRAIFAQLLVEAAWIGVAGGVLGLALAHFGLWVVRQQPSQYARLAHLDTVMLGSTFALAVLAMLLAGLFPAWRACRLPPARLLKTQ